MVGIITHYDVHNHGALLQLNALRQVLKQHLGLEAKALQFDKNYDFTPRSSLSKYKLSVKSVKVYLDFLKQRGIGSTLYNYKKHRLLSKFKTTEGIMGEYYTEYQDLDSVIIGSDEVFALHTGVTPCFFGHALPSHNVISYAASFGPTNRDDLSRLHCEELIGSGLSKMRAISVRDRNSQSIVKSLVDTDVPIVLDPVLLYGYTEEIARIKCPYDRPYMVVYAYDRRMNDIEETTAILKFAREHGLQVISPGFYHPWSDKNINVDPIQLLAWFKYAKYVVTDTFHGSIMSMINHRNFAVYCRDNANKLIDLLSAFDLTDRVITPQNDPEEILSIDIDYDLFQSRLEVKRAQSEDWLKRALHATN